MTCWHDTLGRPEDALAFLCDPDPARLTPHQPPEGAAILPTGLQAWRRRLLSRSTAAEMPCQPGHDYFLCHPDRQAGTCALLDPVFERCCASPDASMTSFKSFAIAIKKSGTNDWFRIFLQWEDRSTDP